MDPIRYSENEMVYALLNDFYRSLYPLRSSFELLPQYRNRFSHKHELYEWKASRDMAKNVLLSMVAVIFVLTFYQVLYDAIRRLFRPRELSTLLV